MLNAKGLLAIGAKVNETEVTGTFKGFASRQGIVPILLPMPDDLNLQKFSYCFKAFGRATP